MTVTRGATAALGDRSAWRAVRSVAWRPPPRRLVVVVPHPDDEVLGCGGLIARQSGAGTGVMVVAVTDGEAARGVPDPELADRRRREQECSLVSLGARPDDIVRARLPDGEVAQGIDDLVAMLTATVTSDDLLVAPWVGDCHPDHVACGRAAVATAHRIGCPLVGMLVWAPLWGPAPTDAQGPLLRLELTDREHDARLAALSAHRSQLDPAYGTPIVVDDLAMTLSEPVELFVNVDVRRHGT